jgi:iron(III) transport system substrate-binding protein
MRHPIRLALAAGTAAVVLTACGSSPTAENGKAGGEDKPGKAAAASAKVFDKFSGMSGSERTDALVAAAEEEGSVSVYTSNSDIEDIVDAFEDTYDIDVSAYRADSETVLQRLLQEKSANFFGADVVETNSSELNILEQEDQFYPYKSEYRDAVREEGLRSEMWTADRFNAFVVGWNTDLVKPGEEPTSYEDLTDPKWSGKIAMEVADVDWYASLTKYWLESGKSQQEVDDLWAAIAANAKLTKGHTATTELLSAGQFAIFASPYSSNIDDAAADGAPVSYTPKGGEPVQPITVRANGVGLMKHAEHPAAALLFVDFLLTDGQKVLEESKRIPSVPGGFDPIAGRDIIEVPEDELLKHSEKWNKLYEEVTDKTQGTVETED